MCDGQYVTDWSVDKRGRHHKASKKIWRSCGLDDGQYKVHLDDLDLSQAYNVLDPKIKYEFHTTSTKQGEGGSSDTYDEDLDSWEYQRILGNSNITPDEKKRQSDEYIYSVMFHHTLSDNLGFSSYELERYLKRPLTHSYFIRGSRQTYNEKQDIWESRSKNGPESRKKPKGDRLM